MGTVLRKVYKYGIQATRHYSESMPQCQRTHWCKLLILGGGAGGCNVAWRFANKLPAKEIILLEPSFYHYYQPGFTLVAAGIKKQSQVARATKDVVPPNVVWFKDHAEELDPDNCTVYTRCGDRICYEYLVVALGMVNQYEQISGLKEALDNPYSGVTTIYSKDYCWKTWCCLKCHRGGHAVFTYPAVGGKCAGAAQKIMYLAEDYWRKRKHRDATSIIYNTGGDGLFGVPKYATALTKLVAAKNIAVNYKTELVEVKSKYAVFVVGDCKGGCHQFINLPYTFLHVTPPMCPPKVLRSCEALTNEEGYLEVDKHTLQHVRYSNVYGLGDCTSTPNSKTAAAVAPQSLVLEQNLTETMAGKCPKAKYDGYGSCSMMTSYSKGILTEFKYDKQLAETFPFDQSKERRLFYFLPRYVFPRIYWNKLIKGKWNGPRKMGARLSSYGKYLGKK